LAGAFFEVDFFAGTGFFDCAKPSGVIMPVATKMVTTAMHLLKKALKRIKY